MNQATTIYNRAGTMHRWRPSLFRVGLVRSLCGLVDEARNLDKKQGITACKRCEAAHKLLLVGKA